MGVFETDTHDEHKKHAEARPEATPTTAVAKEPPTTAVPEEPPTEPPATKKPRVYPSGFKNALFSLLSPSIYNKPINARNSWQVDGPKAAAPDTEVAQKPATEQEPQAASEGLKQNTKEALRLKCHSHLYQTHSTTQTGHGGASGSWIGQGIEWLRKLSQHPFKQPD